MFIAGFIVGLVIGIFVVGARVAGIGTIIVAPITMIIGFIVGYAVKKRGRVPSAPITFTGRVFEFPQAPILIEASLRRAGYVRRRGE